MKKLEAEVLLEYDDEKTARAVADAISPDNFKTPAGLLVETTCENRTVHTKIVCDAKLATFIATIDDLLFCASTAEKVLATARRMK